MQGFRNLEVWRLSHKLTIQLYKLTRAFPKDERYGLTSQLRRATASIGANLAEGCGRGTDGDFARFVHIAMGSASELEYHLLLAKDLEYLQAADHEAAVTKVQSVKRMLAALSKKLRSSIAKADSR